MELCQLWDDPEDISGNSGRKYYRQATINWSTPRLWESHEPNFNVPPSWRGQGGIYAFIRSHWRQNDDMRIAYIGKAINFNKRLTKAHNHFGIVGRRGNTPCPAEEYRLTACVPTRATILKSRTS
ncbi:hypothetical protein GCM10011392_40050 [Wenxinia marina]|nr:hypothetical protein GCM10011392_40050 [Wenxinia marina]